MAADLVPDGLWQEISPLLPPRPKPSPKGGRPPADDGDALRAIIHILRTGTQSQMLLTKAFGVSGSTCWRRFTDWAEAGIWPALHQRLLTRLGRLGGIDAQHGVIDSASVRAVFLGGATRGRTPRIAARTAASGT
jgi:transposase